MYSCHSILECYNLFSGVKLSTRSFCFISVDKRDYIDVWIIKITIKTNQSDMNVCFFQK